VTNDWKDKFKSYCLRTNFHIGLTRPQLEMLCAVADNVEWDRFTYGLGSGPHCMLATSQCLVKRGLIERKKSERSHKWQNVFEITSLYELTEAGKLLVELLKITGIFVVADNAIERRAANKVAKMKKR
jgi:hypothetical protein